MISAACDLDARAHTYYLGICMYEGDSAAVNMMEEVMLPFMVSTSSHFYRCVPHITCVHCTELHMYCYVLGHLVCKCSAFTFNMLSLI